MASFLNAFFGTGDPDLIAGVIWAWDLDFGCSFELQVLQFLSIPYLAINRVLIGRPISAFRPP